MAVTQAIASRSSGTLYLTATLLLAALALGGGTRAGFLGDALLQYLALAVLIATAPGIITSHEVRYRRAVLFCMALAMVPLLQLMPLPSGIRGVLPGHQWIADAYGLFDKPVPGWGISLIPHSTWLSFLSLLPPLAVFFSTLHLGYHDRRKLSFLIIGFGGVSVFLGLLQLAQGPSSPLRFFNFTNVEDAVGFFANRNHFAALLYCCTVLSVAWVLSLVADNKDLLSKTTLYSRAVLPVVASLTLLAIFVIAQAMARSRAGLMLSMVALVAVLPMALSGSGERDGRSSATKPIYAVAAFAIVFSLQFALYRILSRFEADPLQDARVAFARNTWEAAKAYLPFGSGLGSFVWVYPTFEKQADIMRTFANRAHNDVLEALLEAGLLAAALMSVFVFWYARASVRIWTGKDLGISETDRGWMKAASVILLLLAVHSFLDYPLRTSALACVAAFCCALMLPARWHSAGHHGHDEDAHHRAERADSLAEVAIRAGRSGAVKAPPVREQFVHQPGVNWPSREGTVQQAVPRQPRVAGRSHQKWEADVAWPAEWQSKAKEPAATEDAEQVSEPEDKSS